MVRMVRAFREGRVEDARRIHYELSPLFEALFLETNPCPVKEAMEMVGLPAGPPRLPLVRVGEGTRKRLREVLSGLGLLK
ncbi:MAG: dihydrodipicolinate synthase family protein, partial [Candidatus Hadarchaeales archaeon]